MRSSPATGFLTNTATASEFNQMDFVIRQITGKNATATIARVTKVVNDGGVTPVGKVDLQPMVNQTDGAGKSVPHSTLHNVPYLRLQGGANAVIIDPKVGDVGIVVFASHDISKVKETKKQAVPGSQRRFDMSDGLYIGGILNGTPTQYIRFSDDGVEIKATKLKILCDVEVTGKVTVSDDVVSTGGDVTASGKSLKTHVHTGVTGGGSNTGPPA